MTTAPKFKGVQVEFADGSVLTVPPLTLGAVEVLQDRLIAFTGGADKESIALVVDAVLLSLKRNYPDITAERVKFELVDVSNMNEVMAALMDVSGMKRKEQEAAAGEAKAGMSPA